MILERGLLAEAERCQLEKIEYHLARGFPVMTMDK